MKKMTLNNGVEIPIFMLGTNIQNKHLLKEVVYAALNEGCRAFDTSPNYQSGAWLGEILQCAMSDLGLKREELFIQTKLDWKDMISNRVEKAFSEMLKTMRLTYVDAYVMHWPQPDTFVESYHTMEMLYHGGATRAIGVSNFLIRHWLKLFDSNITVIPQVNQIELHPLRTCDELLEFCKIKGIVTESYSPICKMVPELKNNKLLLELSHTYDCSVPQLILAWHICKGLIPINKTTKPLRIRENMTCMEINLSAEDIARIDALDRGYKLIVESFGCPGF